MKLVGKELTKMFIDVCMMCEYCHGFEYDTMINTSVTK